MQCFLFLFRPSSPAAYNADSRGRSGRETRIAAHAMNISEDPFPHLPALPMNGPRLMPLPQPTKLLLKPFSCFPSCLLSYETEEEWVIRVINCACHWPPTSRWTLAENNGEREIKMGREEWSSVAREQILQRSGAIIPQVGRTIHIQSKNLATVIWHPWSGWRGAKNGANPEDRTVCGLHEEGAFRQCCQDQIVMSITCLNA